MEQVNIDCESLYSNLSKSQMRWGVVEKVLDKSGEPIKTRPMMYKAVVHAVILYGSESLVVVYTMMKILGGFYHRISGRISVMTAQTGDGREWEWVSVDVALEVTGF